MPELETSKSAGDTEEASGSYVCLLFCQLYRIHAKMAADAIAAEREHDQVIIVIKKTISLVKETNCSHFILLQMSM